MTSGLEEEDLLPEMEYKYQFIFVVDRSGSMGINQRMEITKDAMKLFLQSLPSGSQFGILSFGSAADWMKIKGKNIIEYNDESRNIALANIQKFDSDFGGTDILYPLTLSFTTEKPDNIKRRIFLLTDGSVYDS